MQDGLVEIQARFHRGDPAALGMLYQGFVALARPVCWSLSRQSKVGMDQARVDQLSHDSAARIVERYLRHKRYSIHSFGPVIRLEVIHAFTEGGHGERPTRKYLERAGALTPEIPVKVDSRVNGDPATYLQDLLSDHARGAEVVVALVHGRTYPKAIRAVGKLVPRQWIYDHAVKLRYVWKLTRRRHVTQNERGDDARCRLGSRGEGAVPAVRTDIQRRRARAAERLCGDRGAGGEER